MREGPGEEKRKDKMEERGREERREVR